MSRYFAFRTPAQRSARLRQSGLCAVCGASLDDVEEHAHHVVPNQAGVRGNAEHLWLASSDNCVVLCFVCHEAVHAGGRYRHGAVAPPDYFPHSHGLDRIAHGRWVAEILARGKAVWP